MQPDHPLGRVHLEEPAAVHDSPRLQFPERGQRTLMSSATSAAVDSAFNTLAHTVLVQNARTLEDLVEKYVARSFARRDAQSTAPQAAVGA